MNILPLVFAANMPSVLLWSILHVSASHNPPLFWSNIIEFGVKGEYIYIWVQGNHCVAVYSLCSVCWLDHAVIMTAVEPAQSVSLATYALPFPIWFVIPDTRLGLPHVRFRSITSCVLNRLGSRYIHIRVQGNHPPAEVLTPKESLCGCLQSLEPLLLKYIPLSHN